MQGNARLAAGAGLAADLDIELHLDAEELELGPTGAIPRFRPFDPGEKQDAKKLLVARVDADACPDFCNDRKRFEADQHVKPQFATGVIGLA